MTDYSKSLLGISKWGIILNTFNKGKLRAKYASFMGWEACFEWYFFRMMLFFYRYRLKSYQRDSTAIEWTEHATPVWRFVAVTKQYRGGTLLMSLMVPREIATRQIPNAAVRRHEASCVSCTKYTSILIIVCRRDIPFASCIMRILYLITEETLSYLGTLRGREYTAEFRWSVGWSTYAEHLKTPDVYIFPVGFLQTTWPYALAAAASFF